MQRDQVIADATKIAPYPAIEKLSFHEGLDMLIRCANQCPMPHAAGRAMIESTVVDNLARRLKVERHFLEHPTLGAAPIEKPIFVIGIPRTGTTLTVNLLDQDARARTLLKWEMNDPIPPPLSAQLRTDPRCLSQKEVQRQGLASGKLKPNIHFEWADNPTECVFAHMQDFKAAGWDAMLPMPEYSEFLLTCNMRPTYAWHKRLLQVLQSGAPGRWVLKAPSHTLFIDALFETYPDARVVWTHRDPLTAVASLASLIANVHRRFAHEPDVAWIRTFYPRQAAEHVTRAMAARVGREAQFFDMYYDQLMRDPVGRMRELYGWLRCDYTPELEARTAAWLSANPQGSMGSHSYSLEEYGIDAARTRHLFEDYLEKYRPGG